MFTKALTTLFWSPNLFPELVGILSLFAFVIVFLIVKFAYVSIIGQHRYKQSAKNLLSQGERFFFESLSKAVSSGLYICPKVRVADLIETDTSLQGGEFWQSFNKISQKHVDFVLCNKNDFSIKAIIELDDKSHNFEDRIVRDRFIDAIFKETDIPLLHVRASSFYNINFLREEINKLIEKNK